MYCCSTEWWTVPSAPYPCTRPFATRKTLIKAQMRAGDAQRNCHATPYWRRFSGNLPIVRRWRRVRLTGFETASQTLRLSLPIYLFPCLVLSAQSSRLASSFWPAILIYCLQLHSYNTPCEPLSGLMSSNNTPIHIHVGRICDMYVTRTTSFSYLLTWWYCNMQLSICLPSAHAWRRSSR